MIYKLIGKAVVVYGWAYVKRRYGRQLGAGAAATVAVAVIAIGTAAYLRSRDLPEG